MPTRPSRYSVQLLAVPLLLSVALPPHARAQDPATPASPSGPTAPSGTPDPHADAVAKLRARITAATSGLAQAQAALARPDDRIGALDRIVRHAREIAVGDDALWKRVSSQEGLSTEERRRLHVALSGALDAALQDAATRLAGTRRAVQALHQVAGDAPADIVLGLGESAVPTFRRELAVALAADGFAGTDKGVGNAFEEALADDVTSLKARLEASCDAAASDCDDVMGRVAAWLATAGAPATSQSTKLGELVTSIAGNPESAAATAEAEARKAEEIAAKVDAFVAAIESLAAAADRRRYSDTTAGWVAPGKKARADAEHCRAMARFVRDALPGLDAETITRPILLHYLDDVGRLVRMLNPDAREIGGAPEAKARLAEARDRARTATHRLDEANALVDAARSRLQRLQDERKRTEARVASASALATLTERRRRDHDKGPLTAATLKRRKACQTTGTGDQAVDGTPDAPECIAAIAGQRSEEARQAELLDQKTDADAEKTAATTEKTEVGGSAQEAAAALSAAEASLAAQRAASRSALADLLDATQDHLAAFAAVRDNAPLLVAHARAGSKDPVRKVSIHAFLDERSLVLRGPADAVESVARIVADLDRPSAQARLTLWTLELGSHAGPRGFKRMNDGLEQLDASLATIRRRTSLSFTSLRDALNDEVREVAAAVAGRESAQALRERVVNPVTWSANEWTRARLHVYSPGVLTKAGYSANGTLMSDSASAAAEVLPDPAATTTLGEVLLVLGLADMDRQCNVLDEYDRRVRELDRRRPAHSHSLVSRVPVPLAELGAPSAGLREELGLDGTACGAPRTGTNRRPWRLPHATSLQHWSTTPFQEEILASLHRVGIDLHLARLKDGVRQLRVFHAAKTDLAAKATADERAVKDELSKIRASEMELNEALEPSVTALSEAFRESGTITLTSEGLASPEQLDQRFRGAAQLDTTNARVAAANETLKRLIIRVEDDLTSRIVQPELRGIRETLQQRGLQVGILQRTSVLARDRLVARVDPRATAELSVTEEADLGAAALQLARLSSGPVAAAGLATKIQTLQGMQEDAPREVYGFTGGGVFEVTPVVDPSGQALRFRFDYQPIRVVRQADGSVDPALPRIEKHAIDTEVQLSNLELREVSRFESNAKLGVRPERSGGLPILKDIPGIREIPLLGWFTRRYGQAATVQESLVFAQTTIYPTIDELARLLANGSTSIEEEP